MPPRLLHLLGLAFLLRLYQLNTPLADWHSFRQADTASVAREFQKQGLDLLSPRYHDFSDTQSGQPNPQGYRMVEFPLISGLVAITQPRFIPLHVYYRLVDILFSLGSLVMLYRLALRLYGSRVAILAALIFALLPYNVYYSRTVLPEIPLVFFGLLSLDLALAHNWIGTVLAASLALLLKPTAVFYFPPAVTYIFLKFRLRRGQLFSLFIALGLSFLPLFLWRRHLSAFPEGVPASDWLFNGNGIRLRPAWFRWLFWERLTKLILGYLGLLPFMAGLAKLAVKLTPAAAFILTWSASLLAYLIILATGNVQHDYYQIITIPLLCFLLALGFDRWWRQPSRVGRGLVLSLGLVAWLISWYQVKGFYQINNWAIIEAGQAVDRLAPKDARVIAPYQGDTAFLYATNRRGWPTGFNIDEKIRQGAQYYVTVNFDDEARELAEKYPIIDKSGRYLLLKLR